MSDLDDLGFVPDTSEGLEDLGFVPVAPKQPSGRGSGFAGFMQDVGRLGDATETAYKHASEFVGELPKVVPNVAAGFMDAAGGLLQGLAELPEGDPAIYGFGQRIPVKKLAPDEPVIDAETTIGEVVRPALKYSGQATSKAATELQEEYQPDLSTDEAKAVFNGLVSVGQNIPWLAFGPSGLLGMSAQAGAQAYADARRKGLSPEQSQDYAARQFLIEGGTEVLPFNFILRLGGKQAAKAWLGTVVSDLAGENIAQALETVNRMVTENPDVTPDEVLSQVKLIDKDTSIASLTSSAVFGGLGGTARGMQALQERRKQQQTQPEVAPAPIEEPAPEIDLLIAEETAPEFGDPDSDLSDLGFVPEEFERRKPGTDRRQNQEEVDPDWVMEQKVLTPEGELVTELSLIGERRRGDRRGQVVEPTVGQPDSNIGEVQFDELDDEGKRARILQSDVVPSLPNNIAFDEAQRAGALKPGQIFHMGGALFAVVDKDGKVRGISSAQGTQKYANDEWSYAIGDEYIRETARILQEANGDFEQANILAAESPTNIQAPDGQPVYVDFEYDDKKIREREPDQRKPVAQMNTQELTDLYYMHKHGIGNRRAWAEKVKRGEIGPVTGVLDLRGFRALNDLVGQTTADTALRQVANDLGRDHKNTAAWGGDEFLVDGQSAEEISANIAALEAYYDANPILLDYTDSQGVKSTYEYRPKFKFGTGGNFEQANQNAQQKYPPKSDSRGRRPRSVSRSATQGRGKSQDRNGNAEDAAPVSGSRRFTDQNPLAPDEYQAASAGLAPTPNTIDPNGPPLTVTVNANKLRALVDQNPNKRYWTNEVDRIANTFGAVGNRSNTSDQLTVTAYADPAQAPQGYQVTFRPDGVAGQDLGDGTAEIEFLQENAIQRIEYPVGKVPGKAMRALLKERGFTPNKTLRTWTAPQRAEDTGLRRRADDVRGEPTAIDMQGRKRFGEQPAELADRSVFDQLRTKVEEKKRKARATLRKKGPSGALQSTFIPGLSQEKVNALFDLAQAYVESGAISFAEFSAAMVKELGEAIRPYLKRIYAAVKERTGFSEMEDVDTLPDEAQTAQPEAPQAQPQAPRGRPELANPLATKPGRSLVDNVDESRKESGDPEVQKDRDVWMQVRARVDADYEGEKARMFAEGFVPDGAVDIGIGKEILRREEAKALQSGDLASLKQLANMVNTWREQGTELARALRFRKDDFMTPAERMGDLVRTAVVMPGTETSKRLRKLDKEIREGNVGKREHAKRVKAKILDEHAARIQSLLKQLAKEGIDITNLTEADLNNEVLMARIIREAQTTHSSRADELYEYWVNAILSSPTTQVVNIAGNVANSVWDLGPQRLTEAALNEVLLKLGVGDPRSARLGEMGWIARGLFNKGMLSTAINRGLRAFEIEAPVFAMDLGFAENDKFDFGQTKAISGKKGRIIRLPGRGLVAADDIAKSIIYSANIGAVAYRLGKERGLTGEALSNYINEQITDPQGEASQEAYAKAIEGTFQNELGVFGKQILSLRKNVPGVRYIIPFVTTVGNIAKVSVRKSPLGILKLAHDMVYGTRQEQIKHAAEQILAWTATMILWGLATGEDDEGFPLITGGPASFEERAKRDTQWRAAQPYSVRIGDRYYSYDRIEPIGTTLGLMVDLMQTADKADKVEPSKTWAEAFKAASRVITEQPFFQGIGDIFRAVEHGETGIPAWAGNFATSWVPNFVRAGLRSSDPYIREYKLTGQGLDWALDLMKKTGQKALPLSEIAPPPKVDIWGEPITRYEPRPASDVLHRLSGTAGQLLSPSRKGAEGNDLDRMILNWNNHHPEEENWGPQPAPNYFEHRGERVYMTDSEYHEFLTRAGKLAKKNLLDPKIRKVLNFQNPTKANMELLKKQVSGARRVVRSQMIAEKKFSNLRK